MKWWPGWPGSSFAAGGEVPPYSPRPDDVPVIADRLNDALTELIAADLRQSYWLKLGEPRGGWYSASPQSRDAWRLVAQRAFLLITNAPDRPGGRP